MFSVNSHLGPLQLSLGRMFIDIVKFFSIYALVLFSFACGKVRCLINGRDSSFIFISQPTITSTSNDNVVILVLPIYK